MAVGRYTRDPKPESRNSKPGEIETRSRVPGTGVPGPETRNPELEAPCPSPQAQPQKPLLEATLNLKPTQMHFLDST